MLHDFCVWLYKRNARHTLRAVKQFIDREGKNGQAFLDVCREIAEKELEAINARNAELELKLMCECP